MSFYLQCRVCRNPVVKEDELVDSYKSGFQVCDNSTVWYIKEDHMPCWVSDAVVKESWQKGKLCCPKCNGKLGSFNFIKILTCQQCDNHQLPPVHILKDRVDKKILAVKSCTSPDNMQRYATIGSMDQVLKPSSESLHQVFTPRINYDGPNTCSRTLIGMDHQHVTSLLGAHVVYSNEHPVSPEILAQPKTDVPNHDFYLIDNNDKSVINEDNMIDQVDEGGSDNDDMNSDFCPEDFIKIRDGELLYEPTLEQKGTNFDPYKELSQNDLNGFPHPSKDHHLDLSSSKDHHVDKTVKFSCLTVVDGNGLTTFNDETDEWSESNLEHNQDKSNEKLDRVQDYGQKSMAMSFKTDCDTFQMHSLQSGNEHKSNFDFSEPCSDLHIQSGSDLEPCSDLDIQSVSGEGNNNTHHILQDFSSTVLTESSQIINRTYVEENNGSLLQQQTNVILSEPFETYQENITPSDSSGLDEQHFIATNAEILTLESQVPSGSRLQSSVDNIVGDQSLFEGSPVPNGEDESLVPISFDENPAPNLFEESPVPDEEDGDIDVDVDIPVDFPMFSERRRRRPNRRSRRENKGKRKEKKELPKNENVYETWFVDFPDEHLCPVCFDLFCEPHACSPCDHVMCEACLRRVGHKNVYNTPCPMCRQLIVQCIKKTELVKTLKDFYPGEYRARLREQRKYLNDKFSPLPHRRTALAQTQEDIRNRILGQRNNLQPQRAKIYLAGFVLLIMIVPVVSLGKAVVNSAIGLVQDIWTWL
ncbi:E3 ubiquitin-protein ligase RNF180 [Mytilus galloprovincialis]|nr:E3 ubiquitin-protein ligase RNF180 [Mytilus galloprovincialis]